MEKIMLLVETTEKEIGPSIVIVIGPGSAKGTDASKLDVASREGAFAVTAIKRIRASQKKIDVTVVIRVSESAAANSSAHAGGGSSESPVHAIGEQNG